MSDAFQEVIDDLNAKIKEREVELHRMKSAVLVLIANAPSKPPLEPIVVFNPAYAGLSLRKAILKLLFEPHNMPNTETAEISKALQAHGLTTTGKSFASNVSATLSDMANARNEVVYVEGSGWQLLPRGRDVFQHNIA